MPSPPRSPSAPRLTIQPRELSSGRPLAVLAFAVMLVIIVRVGATLEPPATVSAVTIDNQAARTVQVDVTSVPAGTSEPDGWLPLGHALRRSTATFHEVIDQGDRWRFRFSYQGQVATVDMTRDELEAAAFAVSVPAELDRSLAAAGVPEAP